MPKIESMLSPLPRHSPYTGAFAHSSAQPSTSRRDSIPRSTADGAASAAAVESSPSSQGSQRSPRLHPSTAADRTPEIHVRRPSSSYDAAQSRRRSSYANLRDDASTEPYYPQVRSHPAASLAASSSASISQPSTSSRTYPHPDMADLRQQMHQQPASPVSTSAEASDREMVVRLGSRVASLEAELSVLREELAESNRHNRRLLNTVADIQHQMLAMQGGASHPPPQQRLHMAGPSDSVAMRGRSRSPQRPPPPPVFHRERESYTRRPLPSPDHDHSVISHSYLYTNRAVSPLREVPHSRAATGPISIRRPPSPHFARAASSESSFRHGAHTYHGAAEHPPGSPRRPASTYSASLEMEEGDELRDDEHDADADQHSLGGTSSRATQVSPPHVLPLRQARRKARQGSGSPTSPPLVLTASVMPTIHHKMSRKADTARRLYEEWTVGLDGGPSIESLNAQYGSQWRRGQTDKNWYSQRSECLPWIRSVAEALIQHAVPIHGGDGARLDAEQAIELGIELADLACRRSASVALPGQDPMPGAIAKFNSVIRNEKRVDKNRDVWTSALLRSIMRRNEAKVILQGLRFRDDPEVASSSGGTGSGPSPPAASVAGGAGRMRSASGTAGRAEYESTTPHSRTTPRSSIMSLSTMTSISTPFVDEHDEDGDVEMRGGADGPAASKKPQTSQPHSHTMHNTMPAPSRPTSPSARSPGGHHEGSQSASPKAGNVPPSGMVGHVIAQPTP